MPLPLEIRPQEVKQRLDTSEKLNLIDVREPQEFAIARIEQGELVPMRSIPGAFERLKIQAEEAPLIVFCHHGVRSLNVVQWLRGQGIGNCQSIAGGIDAWSLIVDPNVPRY